jgi:hypothetical protein
LFVGTIEMVLKNKLSEASILDISLYKGFISPPVWVDINQDNEKDIVVSSVDGRILAFDGLTFRKIWQTKLDDTEAYSSLAVGKFNTDEIPDFFVSFAQGVWPDLSWTKQAMINGQSGKIEYILTHWVITKPLAQ